MKEMYEYQGIQYYTQAYGNSVVVFNAATHQFVYQLHGSNLSEEDVYYYFLNSYLKQD